MNSIDQGPEEFMARLDDVQEATIRGYKTKMELRNAKDGLPATIGGTAGVGAQGSQNDQARAWAAANPNDPRAAAIMQKIGVPQ